MKKFFMLSLFVLAGTVAFAQSTDEKSLFERITKIEKKSDRFNLLLNMHGAFDAKFNHGEDGFNSGNFYMRQLRIEAKGKVNNWLSYRWRQRLNRDNAGGSMIDNLPNSIDIAGIGINATSKFSMFIGKQCAAYGGFEFDQNPIEIYQYSDIIDNMSNFMSGITFAYDFNPNQQLQLQILNSLNASTRATYGTVPSESAIDKSYGDVAASRMPLVYTLNWNANMFNGLYQTRWSFSAMNEAKDKFMFYTALGNKFNFSKKVDLFVDLMSSFEQLDRKGIITNMCGGKLLYNGHNSYNSLYNSVVAKMNYRFVPIWNLFVKCMLEIAAVYKGNGILEKGNYSTSLGYIAGVEFYPMDDSNLHFFLTFVGRSYMFTDRAKAFGNNNYSTQRLSLGFIYQLPMF